MSHLLCTLFFHLELLFSLFFPWSCIPSCSPFIANLRCQQLPVLRFSLFTPLMAFIAPYLVAQLHFLLLLPRSQISGFKVCLRFLLLAGFTLHQPPNASPGFQTSAFLTLSNSIHALHVWCPSQRDSPGAALSLGQSGNQRIPIFGTCFKRGILHFALHQTLCSLRSGVIKNVILIVVYTPPTQRRTY